MARHLALLALTLAACGTLANDRHAVIDVGADRRGGVVWMNGLEVGPAPQRLSVASDRGAAFAVRWPDGAVARCRVDSEIELRWVIGDVLLFGLLLGPTVDAITDGWRGPSTRRCFIRHPGA